MRSCRELGAVFVAAWALACAAPTAPPPPTRPAPGPLAEIGAGLYQQHCASCHGMDGRGDGPVATALVVPPSDLTMISARRGGEFPAGELRTWIDGRLAPSAHGSREMPVWGSRLHADLASGEFREERVRGSIAVIVDFLATIQQTGELPGS